MPQSRQSGAPGFREMAGRVVVADPRHLANSGVCMQLCNLDRLVGKESWFVCLPIKMCDGIGWPVRAAALVT